MSTALLLIDFINDIVDEKGKLASKGYAEYIKRHNTFQKLTNAVKMARENHILVIHIRVVFSEQYVEQPKNSPLFGRAHEFHALQMGTWATEFHKDIPILPNDIIIHKHRVSAFYGTSLDMILKNNNVKSILVAGVATDLAVSSTVREGHDRDYDVTILRDCCAAASDQDHETALLSLAKIAKIADLEEI